MLGPDSATGRSAIVLSIENKQNSLQNCVLVKKHTSKFDEVGETVTLGSITENTSVWFSGYVRVGILSRSSFTSNTMNVSTMTVLSQKALGASGIIILKILPAQMESALADYIGNITT